MTSGLVINQQNVVLTLGEVGDARSRRFKAAICIARVAAPLATIAAQSPLLVAVVPYAPTPNINSSPNVSRLNHPYSSAVSHVLTPCHVVILLSGVKNVRFYRGFSMTPYDTDQSFSFFDIPTSNPKTNPPAVRAAVTSSSVLISQEIIANTPLFYGQQVRLT